MKFGIHLSTFSREWDEDVSLYLSKVREYGYDGVEIPLLSPKDFNVNEMKKLLNDNKLSCTCGTGLNLVNDISSSDKLLRQNGEKHLIDCIDICNGLETDCLGGVLYAPWGQHMMKSEGKDNIERSIESLSKIGEYAEKKGVYLAMEILNRYESYFMNTVEEGKGYLKRINNKNIKLHLDTFHSNIEEKDISSAILRGGEDIYHIHFCENDRGIPGTGSIKWDLIRKALKEIKYDRWITLESFVMPECGVGKDVFIWRNIERDGEYAAKMGIKFMKNLFQEDK